MYTVDSIKVLGYNKIIHGFQYTEENFLRVYSFDRHGEDYSVTFRDTENDTSFTISSNKEIYNFVDENNDSIKGCVKFDSKYNDNIMSYALVRYTKTDLMLNELLEFDETIHHNRSILSSSRCIINIYGLSCMVYGTVFELMFRAFKNQPIDYGSFAYHYKDDKKFSECCQFYILDDFLYILVSKDKVDVYKIKDKRKFNIIFAKKLALTRNSEVDAIDKKKLNSILL